MSHITIRPLNADDAAIYRDLRLEMIVDLPQAYGSALVEEQAKSMADWATQLGERGVFFGAFDGDKLIGSLNYSREKPMQMRHRGWIYAVYVKPDYRSLGVAPQLMERAIELARTEVKQLHLGVGVFNQRAMKFYQRMGFEIYGTDPRGLFVNGQYVDEHFMVKMLDKEDDL